jgi:hypothetical protein
LKRNKEIKVKVNDKMQTNYEYVLSAKEGEWKDEYPEFKPDLTPKKMLELGVFEGKYLNDCEKEFPKAWYKNIKQSEEPNPEVNYYKVKSRQPLSVWKEKGWLHKDDPRGWFQWYCRFYMGRRHEDDDRQIKRWKSFIARHSGQLKANCKKSDLECRKVQRQALMQWAIDSRIL